jgi:transposase
MLSVKARAFAPLCNHSIEDLVPADNFYRYLDAKLDLSFIRAWVQDSYADRGRPSVDPVVFFKLQLIGFFENLRSERHLMRVVADRVSLRWYLGYDWDEPLPDHSSLTRIRERYGLPIFQRFFEHVVELCQEAGLVWGKELIFDSTKVFANADYDSLIPRWYLRAKEHLANLFADDPTTEVLDEGCEANAPAAAAVLGQAARPRASATPADEPAVEVPAQLPFAGSAAEEQRLAGENASAWRLLDHLRLDPERPATRGYQRKTDLRVSTTDADATPIQTGVKPTLGYRDHYTVDGGRCRIILSAVVLPGDIMDNTPLLDLVPRVRFRWQLHPKRAIADSKYGTIDNIRGLEDAGIRAYMPLPDIDERTKYYGPSRFHYEPDIDAYRCPQGQLLRRNTAKRTEAGVMYRAEAATCNACPLKRFCTPSKLGRTLRRSVYAEYVERVRGYHETEAYRKAMRKRQVWVEPLFGEAKDWHGLRRFRLRGLWKVNTEAALIAAGQNLKRWLCKAGWGRRHAPCGSLLALPKPLLLPAAVRC